MLAEADGGAGGAAGVGRGSGSVHPVASRQPAAVATINRERQCMTDTVADDAAPRRVDTLEAYPLDVRRVSTSATAERSWPQVQPEQQPQQPEQPGQQPDMQQTMAQLMEQAQLMQEQFMSAQTELADAEVQGTAGGGSVTATLSGSGELKSLDIDPKVVDPSDTETLADLIVAAVRDAHVEVGKLAERKMGNLASGLDLGGLGGGLGGAGGGLTLPGS